MKGGAMGVLDGVIQNKPTTEQGAQRVKRALAEAFRHAEATLTQVRQIMERHGAANIRSALGEDCSEVGELYQALKSLVEEHKPGTIIPEMPGGRN
jgi:hypothetical protein